MSDTRHFRIIYLLTLRNLNINQICCNEMNSINRVNWKDPIPPNIHIIDRRNLTALTFGKQFQFLSRCNY